MTANPAREIDGQQARAMMLSPAQCRLVLAVVLLLGLAGHIWYLMHDCPIDLSGDEAHYWDWSRQLDLSYYSKGPLVAYIIRASCALLGDTMVAVRLPALLLAVGTSLLTYWLTSKLYGSERLALGVVLLNHLVPMFVAGALFMTIDAPFFFFWACATCFAALAVFHGKPWAWCGVGVAIGLGCLAKYAMLIWPVGVLLFLLTDRDSRRWLRTIWPWLAFVIALLFVVPMAYWNYKHDWVSFRHVSAQTGGAHTTLTARYIFEFLGGQLAALGPPISVLMIGACIWVWKFAGRESAAARKDRFLLAIALPILVLVALTSLRTKVQVNWPAPAYFTLIILTGAFIANRHSNPITWRRWRGWVWCAVLLAIVLTPLAHHFEKTYPLIESIASRLGYQGPINVRKFDPLARLRGWEDLGEHISQLQTTVAPNAFILCHDYQTTAETAFYSSGQPRTYCSGAYASDPARRKRLTQYDIWPDRRLNQPELRGRVAIYVGPMSSDIRHAFDSVERADDLRIVTKNVEVRRFEIWICRGFHGLTLPDDVHHY